jgi:hypothetical protein
MTTLELKPWGAPSLRRMHSYGILPYNLHCQIPQGHYIIAKSSYKLHIKYKSLSFILYFVVTYGKPNTESDKHVFNN